jgi:hypothetical protein
VLETTNPIGFDGKKLSDRRTFALESERLIGKTIVLKGEKQISPKK